MLTVPEYREMLYMDDKELERKIESLSEEDAKELLYLTISFGNRFDGRVKGKFQQTGD